MNSVKQWRRRERGNALLYVLLALALLAGLTMAISSQNDQAGSGDLSAEKAELLTTRTISYATSVKNAIDQMIMTGTQVDSLDYLKPGEAGYNTAPFHNRVFHPDGGGISYQPPTAEFFEGLEGTPPAGWYISDEGNVEWTRTAATDVILVAYRINKNICEAINKKITGTADIPALSNNLALAFLSTADGGGGAGLSVSECAECEGYPTLCVSNNTADNYAYYNIIAGR